MPAAWPGLSTSLGVEAMRRAHEALAPQHLVAAGDAAGEVVGDVEDDAVAVGHHGVERQHLVGHGAAAGAAPGSSPAASTAGLVHTLQCPSSPPRKRTIASRSGTCECAAA